MPSIITDGSDNVETESFVIVISGILSEAVTAALVGVTDKVGSILVT